jgi:hypothetical protein
MEDEPDYHAFRIVDERVEEVPVLIEDHINL